MQLQGSSSPRQNDQSPLPPAPQSCDVSLDERRTDITDPSLLEYTPEKTQLTEGSIKKLRAKHAGALRRSGHWDSSDDSGGNGGTSSRSMTTPISSRDTSRLLSSGGSRLSGLSPSEQRTPSVFLHRKDSAKTTTDGPSTGQRVLTDLLVEFLASHRSPPSSDQKQTPTPQAVVTPEARQPSPPEIAAPDSRSPLVSRLLNGPTVAEERVKSPGGEMLEADLHLSVAGSDVDVDEEKVHEHHEMGGGAADVRPQTSLQRTQSELSISTSLTFASYATESSIVSSLAPPPISLPHPAISLAPYVFSPSSPREDLDRSFGSDTHFHRTSPTAAAPPRPVLFGAPAPSQTQASYLIPSRSDSSSRPGSDSATPPSAAPAPAPTTSASSKSTPNSVVRVPLSHKLQSTSPESSTDSRSSAGSSSQGHAAMKRKPRVDRGALEPSASTQIALTDQTSVPFGMRVVGTQTQSSLPLTNSLSHAVTLHCFIEAHGTRCPFYVREATSLQAHQNSNRAQQHLSDELTTVIPPKSTIVVNVICAPNDLSNREHRATIHLNALQGGPGSLLGRQLVELTCTALQTTLVTDRPRLDFIGAHAPSLRKQRITLFNQNPLDVENDMVVTANVLDDPHSMFSVTPSTVTIPPMSSATLTVQYKPPKFSDYSNSAVPRSSPAELRLFDTHFQQTVSIPLSAPMIKPSGNISDDLRSLMSDTSSLGGAARARVEICEMPRWPVCATCTKNSSTLILKNTSGYDTSCAIEIESEVEGEAQAFVAPSSVIVPASSQRSVQLTFAPKRAGSFRAILLLVTPDGDVSDRCMLEGQADVPHWMCDPADLLSFGDVEDTRTVEATLCVTNTSLCSFRMAMAVSPLPQDQQNSQWSLQSQYSQDAQPSDSDFECFEVIEHPTSHERLPSSSPLTASPKAKGQLEVKFGPQETKTLIVRFSAKGYDRSRGVSRAYSACLTMASVIDFVDAGDSTGSSHNESTRMRLFASVGFSRIQVPRESQAVFLSVPRDAPAQRPLRLLNAGCIGAALNLRAFGPGFRVEPSRLTLAPRETIEVLVTMDLSLDSAPMTAEDAEWDSTAESALRQSITAFLDPSLDLLSRTWDTEGLSQAIGGLMARSSGQPKIFGRVDVISECAAYSVPIVAVTDPPRGSNLSVSPEGPVYFGGLGIGTRKRRVVCVKNEGPDYLLARVRTEGDEGTLRVIGKSFLCIAPYEDCEVMLEFEPHTVQLFSMALVIESMWGHVQQVPLFGYGGTSNVAFTGLDSNTVECQVPNDSLLSFHLRNTGARCAFILCASELPSAPQAIVLGPAEQTTIEVDPCEVGVHGVRFYSGDELMRQHRKRCKLTRLQNQTRGVQQGLSGPVDMDPLSTWSVDPFDGNFVGVERFVAEAKACGAAWPPPVPIQGFEGECAFRDCVKCAELRVVAISQEEAHKRNLQRQKMEEALAPATAFAPPEPVAPQQDRDRESPAPPVDSSPSSPTPPQPVKITIPSVRMHPQPDELLPSAMTITLSNFFEMDTRTRGVVFPPTAYGQSSQVTIFLENLSTSPKIWSVRPIAHPILQPKPAQENLPVSAPLSRRGSMVSTVSSTSSSRLHVYGADSVFGLDCQPGTLPVHAKTAITARFSPLPPDSRQCWSGGLATQYFELNFADPGDSESRASILLSMRGETFPPQNESSAMSDHVTESVRHLPVQQDHSPSMCSASARSVGSDRALRTGDVFIRNENVRFPPTAAGRQTYLKMEICNRSQSDLTARVRLVQKPFRVLEKHQTFVLRHRSFVHLPVVFVPEEAGDGQSLVLSPLEISVFAERDRNGGLSEEMTVLKATLVGEVSREPDSSNQGAPTE